MLSSFLPDACCREAAGVAFVGAFDALGIQTALGLSLPSPTIFAQYFVFAVLLGGIYGLIALGLTMIFGVMDVINFAHGALMVVAMYAVLVFSDATGLSPFFAIPFAVLLLFVFGVVIYRSTIAPIIDAPQENQLIVTFGVLLILISGVEIAFGSDPRQLGLDLGSLEISGVFVPQGSCTRSSSRSSRAVWNVAVPPANNARSRDPRDRGQPRRRAVRRDRRPRIDALTFGIGAALAGLAGAVIPLFQSFTPALGDQYLINAFVVVVLGGLGSFPGAFVGGLIIGFIQVFGSAYLGGSTYQIVIFMAFILVLLVKPEGLLGGRR